MQHINPNDSAIHLGQVYVSPAPLITIDAGREPWEIEVYAQHFDAIAERAQTR